MLKFIKGKKNVVYVDFGRRSRRRPEFDGFDLTSPWVLRLLAVVIVLLLCVVLL